MALVAVGWDTAETSVYAAVANLPLSDRIILLSPANISGINSVWLDYWMVIVPSS